MKIAPLTWLAVVLLTAHLAPAQPASRPSGDAVDDDPRNQGFSEIKFTERSPNSPIEVQNRRHQIKIEPSERYDLATENFAALVPPDYERTSDKPWGLLVWISAGPSGTPSRGWAPILAKHRLIWIGPNKVGNERAVGVRFGLALDAAYNFQKQYNIDSGRVYVAGVSGGAKVATMLATIYPEVFNGAIAMAGTTYFRPIPVNGNQSRAWQPNFGPPPAAMLDRAKIFGRFVLLTGTLDMNRDAMRDTYQSGFMPDGFKHVEYVEIEGMGHGIPEAKWVESAIDSLDAPLATMAKEQFTRAQALDKAGKTADAVALYTQAELHGDEALAAKAIQRLAELKSKGSESPPAPVVATPQDRVVAAPQDRVVAPSSRPATPPAAKPVSDESEAASLLSLAENYERNRLYTQAIQRLEKIIKDYPTTKAAAQAKISLERVKTKQRSP